MPSSHLPRISRRLMLAVALTNLGVVAGIVVAMWLTEDSSDGVRWLLRAVLIALVLAVGASILRRRINATVEAPLSATIAAAEAIAEGDVHRRVERGITREFDALSLSINRMTEQILEAHKLNLRVEKLATMGRLAAGVSHEIGNPLAAIANYSHLLRMRAENDPKAAEVLDAMDREIARVDRIMRGLLDYARPRRLTPKPIIIDEVITDVLRLLADQGHTRRLTLHTELTAPSAAVYGERHDLEQIFVNLLLNAVDAVEGTGTIAIRSRAVSSRDIRYAAPIRHDDVARERWRHKPSARAMAWLAEAERPDRVLQVIVADSGPGVREEDEERIFEPFFSTKVPSKGTGLGLAIVASTIENLGGTIWVQHAREGGAAFVMLFPLHESMRSGMASISGEHATQ